MASDVTFEMGNLPVLVSIVTYDSEAHLDACLRSVREQDVPVRIRVFDNASRDRSRQVALDHGARLHRSDQNRGFSHGHNFHLRQGGFDHVLILNPDVILSKGYLKTLMGSMAGVKRVGMAGGKLHRMDAEGRTVHADGHPVLDTTGIFFTPTQRHFDRGSQQPDRGQYDRRELVFGISGAALLCTREMLEDLRYGDEYLDEDFFAYREDADLAWRAQLRGWRALYEPAARGLHVRRVLPARRARLASHINYHSLKNRYLMRIKNLDPAVRRRCFPYMWIRDLGIVAYVLLRERSSLGAYRQVWKLRNRFLRKRKWVRETRRAPAESVARWFSFRPVAHDPGPSDLL